MKNFKYQNFNIQKVINLNLEQKSIIYKLWNENYPKQLEFKELSNLDQYLQSLNNPVHFFIENTDIGLRNKIFAWAVVFERENEQWFAIIIDNKFQKKGIGNNILNFLKTEFDVLNGWVIDNNDYFMTDNSNYHSPLGFYIKNGSSIIETIRLETDKISAVKIKWSNKQ